MNYDNMTDQEKYVKDLLKLKVNFASDKQQLSKKYAFSNKVADVGFVLEDHIKILEVTKIQWRYNPENTLPECVYFGNILTKKGLPRKDNKTGLVYPENIKCMQEGK